MNKKYRRDIDERWALRQEYPPGTKVYRVVTRKDEDGQEYRAIAEYTVANRYEFYAGQCFLGTEETYPWEHDPSRRYGFDLPPHIVYRTPEEAARAEDERLEGEIEIKGQELEALREQRNAVENLPVISATIENR